MSRRVTDVERVITTALPLLLAAGAFIVAFAHVVEVAVWAGQPYWAAIVIASTGEMMFAAAVLDMRHRYTHGAPGTRRPVILFAPPAVTMAAAIGMSAAANLAGAGGLTGAPGVWGPVMAVWPVIAFVLVAIMRATRTRCADDGVTPMGDLVVYSGTPPAPTPARRGHPRRTDRDLSARASDDELAAVLDGLPRDSDGKISIRTAMAAMGCGADRARRILAARGLHRTHRAA